MPGRIGRLILHAPWRYSPWWPVYLSHTVWPLAPSAYLSPPCSWGWGPTCLLGPHTTFLFLDPPCFSYSVTVLSNLLPQMPRINRYVAIVSIMAVPASLSCRIPDQHVVPDHVTQQVLSNHVSAPLFVFLPCLSSAITVICQFLTSQSNILEGNSLSLLGTDESQHPWQCLAHDRWLRAHCVNQ